jgi:Cytochrome c
MKRLGKILLVIFASLVVLLVIAITFTIGWRPFIGPRARALTSRTFERTPERLARGEYLVKTRACFACHSQHNWSAEGMARVPGTEGSGDIMPFLDLPGRVVASNLTPDPETGAGNWTDDQFARAIREGIGHDGRALFPMMPYLLFQKMSDEDLASIIVYLRSIPAVRHKLPKTEIIFPVKYLIRNAPRPVTKPVMAPDPGNRVKWGEYLATMSWCIECHTPMNKGQAVKGMDFAGGFPIEWPGGKSVASANITPDPSGISYYDEDLFIKAIRTGKVGARQLNPVMPYAFYRNYSDDDLKAIFAYLRTLKPIKHRVDNTLPPTQCRVCGLKHGGGDQN